MKTSRRQLEQLMQDLEDGGISSEDHALLMRLLVEDPAARLSYCRHMAFSGAMHSEAEARAGLAGWGQRSVPDRREGRLFANSVLAAAAILLLAALVAAVITLRNATPMVAELSAPPGTEWSVAATSGSEPSGGSLSDGSTLEIRSGMVLLALEDGTRMIAHGPARISFPSVHQPLVERGCLWIDKAAAARAVCVTSCGWEFRDIGTRFAVKAREDGRAELHVVEGEVRANPVGEAAAFTLPASQTAVIVAAGDDRELVVRADDPFPQLDQLLAAPARYETTVLGQSPVGYWPLEKSTSDGLENRISPLHRGQADTRVRFDTPGPRPADGFQGFPEDNRSANLPGNSSESVIYDLDSPQGVSPGAGAVSLWFRRAPNLKHREVLWFAGSEAGVAREIQVFLDPRGELRLFFENGERDLHLGAGATVHDGRWHHVAATWGSGAASLYLDGRKVAEASGTAVTDATRFRGGDVRAGKVSLHALVEGGGREDWNMSDAFTGQIDELALWDRQLTGEEIARQYESAVGRPE